MSDESLKNLVESMKIATNFDANKDGQISSEEWNNYVRWYNKQNFEENFVELVTQTEYAAWSNLFFELSHGSMEISQKEFEQCVEESSNDEVDITLSQKSQNTFTT